MKLPRDLTGAQLIKALEKLDYRPTRQTCLLSREHYLTVPLHDPLRIGTLTAILADVTAHHDTTRVALMARLFGKS
jgi:hypothetical protein